MASTDRLSGGLRTLLTSLATAALGAAAGVLLGGWLAFETPHWRGFRRAVENAPVLAAFDLAVVLLALALLVGVLGAYARRPAE